MFSGIITALEKPITIKKNKNSMEVTLPIPEKWNVHEGDSINVDGICSTVKSVSKHSMSFYYMPETLSKTTLGELPKNHLFNLEQPLTLQTLISGHLVSGHVDMTMEVFEIKHVAKSQVISFKVPKEFVRFIVYKGSITINGVSLTVVSIEDNKLTVSLIPYTLEHTNLGNLSLGNKVNGEVDLIAKYLDNLIPSHKT